MGKRHSDRPARRLRFAAIALGFAIAGLSHRSAFAEQLFGTIEFGSHDFSMFPKWRHMLRAFTEEVKDCPSGACDHDEWQAIIKNLRDKSLMAQLRETNVQINRERYVADQVNWTLPDYWATPFEFLQKGGGDCEDYAIAKYMVLRDIGVPVDNMRIVVLKDLDLHVDHAVLAVYIDGRPFILDNRYSDVLPANSLHGYEPVYSINERGWWLHLPSPNPTVLARDSEERLITMKMPAAPVTGVDGQMFAVQLASLQAPSDAMRESAAIRARYSEIFADMELSIRKVDLDRKGIWYRVLAGPFASREIAIDLCAKLRAASSAAGCIVISARE